MSQIKHEKDKLTNPTPSSCIKTIMTGWGEKYLSKNYRNEVSQILHEHAPSRMIVHDIGYHTGQYGRIAVTRDGRHMITANDDRTVRIWHVETGQCLRMIRTGPSEVRALAVSPDMTRIATGAEDGKVTLWNAQTGNSLAVSTNHEAPLRTVEITPDGKRILSGDRSGVVTVWNPSDRSQNRILYSHRDSVSCITTTPDGRRIITGSADTTIRICDIDAGQCVHIFSGHNHDVTAVDLTHDGLTLVSGSRDGTVRIWNFSTGTEVESVSWHPAWVQSLTVTAQGDILVATRLRDSTRKVWNFASGHCIATLRGHRDTACDLAITGDGTQALSVSLDRTAKAWDLSTGQCMRTFDCPATPASGIIIVNDGIHIVTTSWSGPSILWNIATGKPTAIFENVSTAAFSPSDTWLITGDDTGDVMLRDGLTGNVIRHLGTHKKMISSIIPLSGGAHCLTGSTDKTVKLWDTANGTCLRTYRHSEMIRSLAVSSDGTQFAAGDCFGGIALYHIDREEPYLILKGHHKFTFFGDLHVRGEISRIETISGGTIMLTACYDGTIKSWDIKTGKCLHTFEGHTRHVTTMILLRDGSHFLTGSTDGTIRRWNLDNGNHEVVYADEGNGILYMTPTIDRMVLVVSFWDGSILFLDMEHFSPRGCFLNVSNGFLWSTFPDHCAPTGWIWTNRDDLLHIIERDATCTNPEALSFDDQRRRSYVLSRNNRKMVMMRIFDPDNYEEYASRYNHTVTLKGEPTTTAMDLLTD